LKIGKAVTSLACLAGLLIHCAAGAEAGVSETRVVIGQSLGVTGPVATTAEEVTSGLNAYFTLANKRGGVNGRSIELKTADDANVPKRTGENAHAMLDGGEVFLLAGNLGTAHTAETLKVAEAAGAPVICPFSGAASLQGKFNRYLFHIRAGYREEAEKMVDHLLTVGVRRIAAFYQNDPFGQEGLAAIEEALQKRNLKLTASASIERGSLDPGAAVKTLKAAEAQAVIMFAVTRAAAEFTKQMRKAGASPQFFGISINANQDFINTLGEYGRGVGNAQVVPSPWNTALPLVKEYQQAMREAGKEKFSFTSLESFICGKVIVEGLRRAPRALTREKFIAALEGMNPFDLGGFELRYSGANHNGSRYVDLSVIGTNGKFLQ
jgi:ABC-type branched-subunit amino acid transport system substrate-binding protein